MKNWKKVTTVLALVCLLVGMFAACGGNDKGSSSTPPPAASGSSAAEPAPAPEPEPAVVPGESYDLKIAHPQPKGSATDLGYEMIAQKMEEYSGGTIKATIFPAGSLMSSADAVEGLRNGTVDIAQLSSGDVATVVPAINLIEVPGSYSQANTTYVEGLAPTLREILAPYGIRFLYPQPGTASWFLSNKLSVTSPDQMKGLKVRASGKYGGQAIELWGGSPVTLTLADLTQAMERNTVDVVITPGLGAYSNGWYELEHYINVTQITTLMAMIGMREDLFQGMTPEQQDAVYKAALEGAMYMYDETMKEVATGFDVMEQYGNEVYELTEAENNAFKEMLQPLRDQIIAEVGADAEKLETALKQYR